MKFIKFLKRQNMFSNEKMDANGGMKRKLDERRKKTRKSALESDKIAPTFPKELLVSDHGINGDEGNYTFLGKPTLLIRHRIIPRVFCTQYMTDDDSVSHQFM